MFDEVHECLVAGWQMLRERVVDGVGLVVESLDPLAAAPAVADQRLIEASICVGVGTAMRVQPLRIGSIGVGQVEFTIKTRIKGKYPGPG